MCSLHNEHHHHYIDYLSFSLFLFSLSSSLHPYVYVHTHTIIRKQHNVKLIKKITPNIFFNSNFTIRSHPIINKQIKTSSASSTEAHTSIKKRRRQIVHLDLKSAHVTSRQIYTYFFSQVC